MYTFSMNINCTFLKGDILNVYGFVSKSIIIYIIF